MTDNTETFDNELDLAEIDNVLGQTRSKTNAAEFLRTFLDSGKLGIEVDLNSGSFVGKDAKQVKMAFDNARKKVSDIIGELVIAGGTDVQVRVKQVTNGLKGDAKQVIEEHLYLINVKLVAEARCANSQR